MRYREIIKPGPQQGDDTEHEDVAGAAHDDPWIEAEQDDESEIIPKPLVK